MFRLQLHELLFVYTGLCLAVVLLASALHNLLRTRREEIAMRDFLKCHLCAFEFRDATAAELPTCPSCGSLVNRDPLSRL